MQLDVLPTGSLALDNALRVGGWPRGQLVELYGDESSGKTTLSLLACRSAQRAGTEAAYVDLDRTLDASYADHLGVSTERLLVATPEHGETVAGTATRLLRSGVVGCIVIDSAAAINPATDEPGAHRKLVDKLAQSFFSLASRYSALVIMVNRPVHRPARAGGWVEQTTGGNKLPALASVRVRLEALAREEGLVRTRVTVEKNAHRPARGGTPRACDLVLRWGAGIDYSTDLLVAAFDAGVISTRGRSLWFGEHQLGGVEEARAALLSDVGLKVRAAVLSSVTWRRA